MSKKQIGPTFTGNYPPEMRRQLWPLCCGASILSGFKDVASLSDEKLTNQILDTIDNQIPDFQVYAHETMTPKLTFLTLNAGQTGSPKIMEAIKKAGFVLVGTATPRGGLQSFFVRDTSQSWKGASDPTASDVPESVAKAAV